MALKRNSKNRLSPMNSWPKIHGKTKRLILFANVQSASTSSFSYLLLPLICSERAWAYAMQLKSKFCLVSIIWRSCHLAAESNTETRKKFHLLNRLRKAVKHAEQLETLCNQQKTCDARTKLEVQVRNSPLNARLSSWAFQAYTAVMNGHLKFELQAWNDALQFYIRAQ